MSEVVFSKPATYSKVRVIRAELPRTNADGETVQGGSFRGEEQGQ